MLGFAKDAPVPLPISSFKQLLVCVCLSCKAGRSFPVLFFQGFNRLWLEWQSLHTRFAPRQRNGIFGLWRNNMSFSTYKTCSKDHPVARELHREELWCKFTSPTQQEGECYGRGNLSYNLNYAHLPMNNDNKGGLFHSTRQSLKGFGWLLQLDELWPYICYDFIDISVRKKKQFPCFILTNLTFFSN